MNPSKREPGNDHTNTKFLARLMITLHSETLATQNSTGPERFWLHSGTLSESWLGQIQWCIRTVA